MEGFSGSTTQLLVAERLLRYILAPEGQKLSELLADLEQWMELVRRYEDRREAGGKSELPNKRQDLASRMFTKRLHRTWKQEGIKLKIALPALHAVILWTLVLFTKVERVERKAGKVARKAMQAKDKQEKQEKSKEKKDGPAFSNLQDRHPSRCSEE